MPKFIYFLRLAKTKSIWHYSAMARKSNPLATLTTREEAFVKVFIGLGDRNAGNSARLAGFSCPGGGWQTMGEAILARPQIQQALAWLEKLDDTGLVAPAKDYKGNFDLIPTAEIPNRTVYHELDPAFNMTKSIENKGSVFSGEVATPLELKIFWTKIMRGDKGDGWNDFSRLPTDTRMAASVLIAKHYGMLDQKTADKPDKKEQKTYAELRGELEKQENLLAEQKKLLAAVDAENKS